VRRVALRRKEGGAVSRFKRWRANRAPWAGLRVVVILIYIFSLAQILTPATVSFKSVTRSYFPPRGFSFRWWERAFAPEWLDPLWFSIKLGSLTAPLPTPLAVAPVLRL